jgi:uncharacterized membrane protein YdbT with pleckstrin-like domain
MAYSRELLGPNEQISVDLHPYWSTLLGPTCVPTVFLVVTIVIGVKHWLHGPAALLVALIWLVLIIWILVRVAQYRTTQFVVTNARIIFRRGVLSKDTSEIPLDSITNSGVKRTLLERLLGDGDVVVESAGRDSATHFHDIANPEQVQLTISRLVNERTHPNTIQPSTVAQIPPNLADQLERLVQLHANGSLTDAEFSAAKAKLTNS